MRSDRIILTAEEIRLFTDKQLEEAKEFYKAKIEECEKQSAIDTYVINNDVNSRKTPQMIKKARLAPYEQNLALIEEAIKNRKSVIDFMNTPDPDLDGANVEPLQDA